MPIYSSCPAPNALRSNRPLRNPLDQIEEPHQQTSSSSSSTTLPGHGIMSSRDMELLKKTQHGKTRKTICRYNRAVELTKASHDPLWYAASLEGCCAALIAIVDVGGNGVDQYLDENFRLPKGVLALAKMMIFARANSNSSKKDSKGKGAIVQVDRTKTTMPAAVFALAEEACGILCWHELLAPLYVELMLKLAWYTAENEGSHSLCQWGEGGGAYSGDRDSSVGGKHRWESSDMSELLKLDE